MTVEVRVGAGVAGVVSVVGAYVGKGVGILQSVADSNWFAFVTNGEFVIFA